MTPHVKLRSKYLHTVDVNAAHAAAAVNEEDKLAVNLPQVGADGLEVRAEVQHDHRVVEDVLMEPPVNDIYLEKAGELKKKKKSKASVMEDSEISGLIMNLRRL